MKAVIVCASLLLLSLSSQANWHCYGVHSQGVWKTVCGEVPEPAPHFAVPTLEKGLNANDKLYICSLMEMSEADCALMEFTTVAGGLGIKDAKPLFGLDVRIKFQLAECAGTVWKTQNADGTWSLSSPTAVSSWCNINRVQSSSSK